MAETMASLEQVVKWAKPVERRLWSTSTIIVGFVFLSIISFNLCDASRGARAFGYAFPDN